MTHYFFDCTDGDALTVDEEGLHLADLAAAKDEALRTLLDVARDEMTEHPRRDYTVDVRTDAGCVIWTATISLQSRDLVQRVTNG